MARVIEAQKRLACALGPVFQEHRLGTLHIRPQAAEERHRGPLARSQMIRDSATLRRFKHLWRWHRGLLFTFHGNGLPAICEEV